MARISFIITEVIFILSTSVLKLITLPTIAKNYRNGYKRWWIKELRSVIGTRINGNKIKVIPTLKQATHIMFYHSDKTVQFNCTEYRMCVGKTYAVLLMEKPAQLDWHSIKFSIYLSLRSDDKPNKKSDFSFTGQLLQEAWKFVSFFWVMCFKESASGQKKVVWLLNVHVAKLLSS